MKKYCLQSKQRNILHTMKRRTANWVGHILHRNCLLKHIIEGNIEGRIEATGRLEQICMQVLNDLKETIGYCTLYETALARTL
jgi:hypothetical protein